MADNEQKRNESDCTPTEVIALKSWNGEEIDKLAFQKNDSITITKKDGAGWAFGSLSDGSSGWFPLDCVVLPEQETTDDVPAEHIVGRKTALDAFIEDAQKKKVVGPLVVPKQQRNHSLQDFLASRPMREQLVQKNILPSEETIDQVQAAQKRLLKQQKRKKKEAAEILIEKIRQGQQIENPFKLTELQIDRIVLEIISEIPLTKQKHHFSSYEDVFSGATLIQHLKQSIHKMCPKWESGISNDDASELARNLVVRHVIIDVVDPGSQKFKSKHLYQLSSRNTDYSVMNLDKIYTEKIDDVVVLSVRIIGEMVEAMKQYLPDFESLRKSKELVSVGLYLAALQKCSLEGLSPEQRKVFFVNIYNALVLFTHSKLIPPTTAMDRRYLYEYCSVFTNNKRYSLQDLETEALNFATKKDPLVYFCLSDCTRSTPATYLFSVEDFETTATYAARHFLNKAMILDSSNYELQLPKMFQRVWKDLSLPAKEDLVDLLSPYMSSEQRKDIQNIREVGTVEVKFLPYSFEPSYIFEETSPLSPR